MKADKIKQATAELSKEAGIKKEEYMQIREELFEMCEDDEGKIDFDKLHFEFSKILITKYTLFTFNDTDEIFVYSDGIYEFGDKKIMGFIQKVLGKYAKIHRINEILAHVRRQTYKKRADIQEEKNMICLENGVLNLTTLKIEKHSSSYIFFNKIPVHYVEKADCLVIKTFLSEIVASDDIPILQEIAGYTLYKNYFIHKAIMLVGGGANGKSTFINLLKTFLGQENCVSIPLHHLEEDKFALANLYGKFANLFADLPSRALKNTSIFKMLVGEDLIPAEKKFKDKFFFTNYAKQIFSANQVPQSPDDSDAFFRRWVILNFPNQFLNSKADKTLLSKLTTKEELSGFLNFAIAGLKRVIEQQDFSNTQSVDKIRETYVRLSDSVGAFVMDCVEISPDDYQEKKKIFTAYADYCREKKYPIVSENTFYKELPKQIRLEDYRPSEKNESGERPRCWKGLKVIFNSKNTMDEVDKVDSHA